MFWLSSQPMVMGKRYKMKLAGTRTPAWLTDIATVLDASELSTAANRKQIERHDVAECTLETLRPVACDLAVDIPQTGRFVIIDNYEIAGGGVVLEAAEATDTLVDQHVRQREQAWDRSSITSGMRAGRYNQQSALVLICGPPDTGKREMARKLEEYLFNNSRFVYYLGLSNSLLGIDADIKGTGEREEFLRRLGEVAHLFTDAGMILITTVSDLDDYELGMIDKLNQPNELVVVNVGESRFTHRTPDMQMETGDLEALQRIRELLQSKNYLPEYNL